MVSTLVSVSLFHCYVYFISPFYEDDCYPKEISFYRSTRTGSISSHASQIFPIPTNHSNWRSKAPYPSILSRPPALYQ